MSDALTGMIRTWVPVGVGAALAWLATLGVEIDGQAQAGLVTGLTALAIAVYYTVVAALQRRWPWLGVLLGSRRQPTYAPPRETDTATRQGLPGPSPN